MIVNSTFTRNLGEAMAVARHGIVSLVRNRLFMEPRPQSSRPAHDPASTRRSPLPSGGGGETRSYQPSDPAAAPSRADYDYSPLDLAPPGQRRRRQLVAAVLGGLVMVLLVGGVVFAFLMLRDDDDPDDDAMTIAAAQTVVAEQAAADVPEETVDAPTSGTEPAATNNESGSPASDAPTEVPEDAETQSTAGDAAGQALEPTPPQPAQNSAASGALTQDQLLAMLPDVSAVPPGLDSVTEATRTQADVVVALGGNREAETNLQNWGWSGNAERDFMASNPEALGPEATTNITVSLHGFADEQAAAEALPFYSDILLNLGYEEASAGNIGTANRLLQQPQEGGGMLVALYVQEGNVLYRIGGFSLAGDPTLDVLGVASAMIGQ